jgi:glycerol-3-phosphate dehydrogenase (NAD(P)+)
MKIGVLGIGSWGICLADHLAKNNNQVVCWSPKAHLVSHLSKTGEHSLFPGHLLSKNMVFTTDLKRAMAEIDMLVESVTSAGIRPVFEQVRALGFTPCPIVITSKGIEQNSEEILPKVVLEVLGSNFKDYIGVLSGPSFAQEVIKGLPTSIVASGYHENAIQSIVEAFTNPSFRVYPNHDIMGVSLGGALKNPIAIACGIADKLGNSTKAALMTRGLHEINKLAVALGAKTETMIGLAGMGDLCLTCFSPMSRNYRFGMMLAQGVSGKEAMKNIGMVVEGAYTCVSALQLGKHYGIDLPIMEAVLKIIEGEIRPEEAMIALMGRPVKAESL